MQFITKLRRDRWRDQVILVGERLRRYEADRAAVSSDLWPEDTQYLDSMIEFYTRKRDRLLNLLKETA